MSQWICILRELYFQVPGYQRNLILRLPRSQLRIRCQGWHISMHLLNHLHLKNWTLLANSGYRYTSTVYIFSVFLFAFCFRWMDSRFGSSDSQRRRRHPQSRSKSGGSGGCDPFPGGTQSRVRDIKEPPFSKMLQIPPSVETSPKGCPGKEMQGNNCKHGQCWMNA